jgi:acyl-coenzyme A synthetase/AMP-(fatty) acid ligase
LKAKAHHPNYVLRALDLFAKYGDREALAGGGRRLSYTELRGAVLDMAAALREHGVRSGMTVAVVIGHPPEGPVVHLALHLLGCRSVWVRSGVTRREVSDYLRLTGPQVVVYDARTADPFGGQLCGQLAVPVLCLGPHDIGPDLLAPRARPVTLADLGPITGQPDVVFQTSGTTGAPKLIVQGHDLFWQIIRLAEQIVAAGEPIWRHLSLSVLSHVSGQISALLYLFAGGVLVLMEDYRPEEFLATVERERINSTFISPPDLYEILDHPALPTTDCSSMRMLSVGAAPAAPARLRQAVDRFGPVVRITYGLSESPFISAFPNITDDPEHPDRLRSCGQPYGDVRVEVRDECGTPVRTGELGELWVSSMLNFSGYLGQPELTAQTLVDGWVRTRDLGYADQDGYLYLVGRTQDVIITGQICEKVYPRPIEDVLAAHPQVRAAAVIGVPDRDTVEAVHAYIVLADHATVTAGELIALVSDQLAEVCAPRSMDIVDRLPVNQTGKVDRTALRAKYAAEHGSAVIGTPG